MKSNYHSSFVKPLHCPILRRVLIIICLFAGIGARAATSAGSLHPLCVQTFGVSADEVQELISNRKRASHIDPIDPKAVQNGLGDLIKDLPQLQQREFQRYFVETLKFDRNFDGSLNARENLSRENLRQALKDKTDLSETLEFKLAWKTLEQSLQHFRHNTVQGTRSAERQPLWLSSQRLMDLKLDGGLQSSLPFNRDFLATSDWNFFWVDSSVDVRYGPNTIFVDRAYADKEGMIFPFIMYESELLQFISQVSPSLSLQFSTIFQREYPTAWKSAQEERASDPTREKPTLEKFVGHLWEEGVQIPDFFAYHRNLFESARSIVASYAFTPADYQYLASTTVAEYLRKLRLQNPKKYLTTMAALSVPYLKAKNFDVILREAMKDARLPFRYEMRIPVAIPRAHFHSGNS